MEIPHPRAVAVLTLLVLSAGACAARAHDEPPPPQAPPASPPQAASVDWRALEAPLLTRHVELTSRDRFVKAGEAYFSPDSQWIIFQAVPIPASGEPDPFYSMYVARLVRDKGGHVQGIDEVTRVSKPGSANTCGWFHPTDPTRVLFGSTIVHPTDEGKSGFQVGTRQYKWMFPSEMEVVEADPFATWGRGRNAVHAPTDTRPVFTRPNYDAECSYDATGRFVLYAHIEDRAAGAPAQGSERPDANIYVYDTKTGKHHAIVVAPGYDGGPFFSPDGKSICYRSDRKGNDLLQLFVADLAFEKDADGVDVPVGVAKEYQLTDNEQVNWCPYWHPSGKFLVYATSEVGHHNYEVFAIESDLGKLRAGASPATMRKARVTMAPGADVLPVFNADGSLMMWTAQRGPAAAGEAKPSSQLWIAEFSGDPFARPWTPPTSPQAGDAGKPGDPHSPGPKSK